MPVPYLPCDIWGELTDLTHGGDVEEGEEDDDADLRWVFGEDQATGASRNMQDPPTFGHPDRMGSEFFHAPPYTLAEQRSIYYDAGYTHSNCGVNNKLASLLTDGGTFNGRTVSAMGIGKVAKLYYECQTNLLTSGADFYGLYYALRQAAVNLGSLPSPYTFTTADRENVEQGCRAVEIRPTVFVSMKNADGDPTIQFTDMGDLILWAGSIDEEDIENAPSTGAEITVKDASEDPLAVFCPTSGDVYLIGVVIDGAYEEMDSLLDTAAMVVYRLDGGVQRPVSLIDFDGDLYLAGFVVQP